MEDVPTQPITSAVPDEKNAEHQEENTAASVAKPSVGKQGISASELKGAPPSFLDGMKKKNPLYMRMNNQRFHSPTDSMMSPCTQKLMNEKKHALKKGMSSIKPKTLSGTFEKINQEDSTI